jgi:hypothetical protein
MNQSNNEHALSKVHKLTRLHLHAVPVIDDFVSRLKAAVVEVLRGSGLVLLRIFFFFSKFIVRYNWTGRAARGDETDGWMDGWMDGWRQRWKRTCV